MEELKMENSNKKIAFKGFNIDENNNLNCRGYIIEVGKTYNINTEIKLCNNGFHFCWDIKNVHNYYNLLQSVVCKVEILGDVLNELNMKKSVTNKIKVLEILTKEQVLMLTNTGKENTGVINSGDYNSGNWNSGNRNSGNRNSGDYNSGNRNSGDYNSGNKNSGNMNSGNRNSGNMNSGDRNSGNMNSGNMNSGNRNSGNMNSGDWNSGLFNTKNNNIFIFNVLSNFNMNDFIKSKFYDAIYSSSFVLNEWVEYTDKEKADDKAKELIGGYLKTYDYKETCKKWWDGLTIENKEIIKKITD
jgi:hypothetical protein